MLPIVSQKSSILLVGVSVPHRACEFFRVSEALFIRANISIRARIIVEYDDGDDLSPHEERQCEAQSYVARACDIAAGELEPRGVAREVDGFAFAGVCCAPDDRRVAFPETIPTAFIDELEEASAVISRAGASDSFEPERAAVRAIDVIRDVHPKLALSPAVQRDEESHARLDYVLYNARGGDGLANPVVPVFDARSHVLHLQATDFSAQRFHRSYARRYYLGLGL